MKSLADLFPRLVLPLALVLLTIGFLIAPENIRWLRWGLVVTLPLLALAIWDLIQTRHSLRRNYPLLARARWLFEYLRPYLRSYIVEGDQEGRPFSHDARALVYQRAKDDISSHPFGTELDVYSEEYEWLSHSIVPSIGLPDHFRIDIGGPQCAAPYNASVLNISAMSFGSLGANAIEALNLGAKQGGFYHDTGEGSFSKYHAKHDGDIVWQIASGYFGCRREDGAFDPERFKVTARREQIKMIEIKLSQGAKPGHGGVLPAPKVTPEIAVTRGVPVHEDCISPVGHSAFSTPREMLEFVAQLRDLSGGKPVGIKLCVGQPHQVFAIMKAMLASGILLDYIVVDGAEGGTGAAPVEFSNRVGMPLKEGLIVTNNALLGTGLEDKIKVGAAGMVYSGAGLAMNAALGADWSNAARSFMFALGCVQSLRCHVGTCPTGVATHDPSRQRGLVVEEKAERVARFHKATVAALSEIVAAMGLETPKQIRPHHLHERINATESNSIDHIYPFLQEGILLSAPEDTPYANYWAAADADSFTARSRVTKRG
ncbi:MAG: FMN-binding glutamate synthase family protein [Sphingomonadaceae bacterium]|nr:FMN-binding glutamate synthase family protein [Sphingomonadaceae bacterium]